MMKVGGVLLAAAMMASAPAAAKNWPSAGGFDIAENDDFCLLASEYSGPGDTTLSVALKRDGSVMLMVLNYNWSAKQGEKYEDISVIVNDAQYKGGFAIGTEIDGRKGFVVKANDAFLTDFVKSTYLHVYKGDAIIDRLTLDGSAAAVAMVKRCVAHVDSLRKAEEREKKKYEDLPTDPFAKKD